MNIIYLSPANHHKPYANGCTEKQQMEKLAIILKQKLEKYKNVTVFIASVFSPSGDYVGRPEEAKTLGASLYVALHTNACGLSSTGGTASGASGFYHADYKVSLDIAKAAVQNLNNLCPIKSNRAVNPAIFCWGKNYWNFGELRVPASYGIPPVLIEHEFHDRIDCANWIVNNLEQIAEADAKAIASVLELEKKVIAGDVNGDGTVNNLDAATVLKYDAGIINLTEEQLKRADFNKDGKVDNVDAAAILKHDAGL